MNAEEAAQWLESWTEAGATSGNFAKVAALIRAQAQVVDTMVQIEKLGHGSHHGRGYTLAGMAAAALAELRRVEEGK